MGQGDHRAAPRPHFFERRDGLVEERRAAIGVKLRGMKSLYARALPAKRSGPLFSAFPYPTKISPEAIALFIAAHTRPGDTVFDGFAGSGATGLGALLCGDPPPELRADAKRLGLKAQWGERHAVLCELGVLGAFIGETLTNPPEPSSFRKAAKELLAVAAKEDGWMYQARDPDGGEGSIRHVVWSDFLRCPSCRRPGSLWAGCVSLAPAVIASRFTCPFCAHNASLEAVERLTETERDPLLGGHRQSRQTRMRRPMWLYGKTGRRCWSRPVNTEDQCLLEQVGQISLPSSVPCVEVPWGDLYRRGYHQGITHLHHFYTRRNLILFARLWKRAAAYGDRIGNALRFWLLSYNAAHATIMSRVVAKSGQQDLVVTSAQPGVLYVSGLPVEKNLLAGLQRKLSTIAKAFALVHGRRGRVDIRQQSSCRVDLPDGSIDYAFTDPPFGGNIPYAEVNFINEAWLGRFTDRTEEAIVSSSQQKTLTDYERLLIAALSEVHRILKPDAKATLVFHSASAEVWRTLQRSYANTGFRVECTSILDKTQGSFKQVTTNGAVRGDPILLLNKRRKRTDQQIPCVWTLAEEVRQEAARTEDPTEMTSQRLYSRLIARCLADHQNVPVDADVFYQWCATQGVRG